LFSDYFQTLDLYPKRVIYLLNEETLTSEGDFSEQYLKTPCGFMTQCLFVYI